jgi:hypothetical protein
MTGNASTRSVGTEASGRSEPKSPTPMGGASVSEVLARLEAAECGGRELDGALMALDYRWEHRHIGATCWDDHHGSCCPGARHLDWVWVDPATDKFVTNAIDGFEFTSSLDRALALADRVLPGQEWRIGSGDGARTLPWARVGPWIDPDATGATPALAFCIAILRARQASNPTAEGV